MSGGSEKTRFLQRHPTGRRPTFSLAVAEPWPPTVGMERDDEPEEVAATSRDMRATDTAPFYLAVPAGSVIPTLCRAHLRLTEGHARSKTAMLQRGQILQESRTVFGAWTPAESVRVRAQFAHGSDTENEPDSEFGSPPRQHEYRFSSIDPDRGPLANDPTRPHSAILAVASVGWDNRRYCGGLEAL
jgi:hypothetical protein